MAASISEERWDVLVVGGGAAGLLAATRAAELGRHVLLVEKNRRPGVKILMSGGTRCNLTQATDARGIIKAFGRHQGSFLHSALARLSPADVVGLVEQEGVATKIEPTGKIFPQSDRAVDVLDALLARLRRSGAQMACDEGVTQCERAENGFLVRTTRRTLIADRLILTTGGKSYPGCGTTGDGYVWAESFGHTIVPLTPALTPVTTADAWVPLLKGVTIADSNLRVLEANSGADTIPLKQKPLAERRGSLLFTHFGLSGPCVLDVSREVSRHPQPRNLLLECDFLPEQKDSRVLEDIRAATQQEGKRTIGTWLAERLPRRLTEALLELAGVPEGQRLAELSQVQRHRLVAAIKQQRIRVQGTRGYQKAEVTAGGVALQEVDSHTMESRLVPGLFFAGEILDLDGPIGGYNFQAAFSTGWLAGESV